MSKPTYRIRIRARGLILQGFVDRWNGAAWTCIGRTYAHHKTELWVRTAAARIARTHARKHGYSARTIAIQGRPEVTQ